MHRNASLPTSARKPAPGSILLGCLGPVCLVLAAGCGGGGGGSSMPDPTVTSFTANPAVAGPGGAVTLTAVFDAGSGGTAVVDQGVGTVSSGNGVATAALGSTTTFTLTVTNTAGAKATRTLQVPVGSWAVLAGKANGVGSSDGSGTAARFNNPFGIAVDSARNAYVADYGNHTIRKVTAAGVVSTLAGSPGVPGSADGTGGAARFNYPRGVALDATGTLLYVADYGNQTLRVVNVSTGAVNTLAGHAGQWGSADGTGSNAYFDYPSGVAVSPVDGSILVADTKNDLIRKVTPGGVVTTLAGVVGSHLDPTLAAAHFNLPIGVAVDAAGLVYVVDTGNHSLHTIASDGTVTLLAGGTGTPGYLDSTGSLARFSNPFNAVVDGSGNVYLTDTGNDVIRKVDATALASFVAGLVGQVGYRDGAAAQALFDWPNGIALDTLGALYVTDYSNNIIRTITSGSVALLAGDAGDFGSTDGSGDAARFIRPQGIVMDSGGTGYVVDQGNSALRTLTGGGTVGTVTLVTGSGPGLKHPSGLARAGGLLYLADTENHRIRTVDSSGNVAVLAGSGTAGSANGTGSLAQFNLPEGVAVTSAGVVYVADTGNHTLRMITSGGVVSTLAGSAGSSGNADGQGASARFDSPSRLILDAQGNLYVADTGNNAIRKVTPSGLVTTVAGASGLAGSTDGPVATARFNGPTGLALDAAGNLYVADRGSHAVRRISPSGQVITLMGVAGQAEVVAGNLPGTLAYPEDLAIDPADGKLYVTLRDAVLQATF